MNRRSVQQSSALRIGLWQNVVACLVLLSFTAGTLPIDLRSLGLVMILGVVFTAAAHVLFIHGLREVSARPAALIGTLEPVYGITAAELIIGETPSLRTVAGGVLIVFSVIAASGWRLQR